MVLNKRTPNLLALLESHAWAFNPHPPTPAQSRASPTEPLEKKRKRDKKAGKETFEEGEVQPSKDQEPPKEVKVAKGQQRRSSTEGSHIGVALDCRTKVPIWNPTLELDGAPLPVDSFIRDFE